MLQRIMKGEKGERRKQELLRIAYRMFIRKGYEHTSIDEIITEAHIAKGTYYYYFPSKEATLEEVINMMINKQVERARSIVSSRTIPVPQKLVGVIASLRPEQDESNITEALNQKENLLMHEKIGSRIVEEAVPLLTEVVTEGITEGIFTCNHIEERVKMILILSQHIFDSVKFTQEDVDVFIDMTEKMLGAQADTLGFIRQLIEREQ